MAFRQPTAAPQRQSLAIARGSETSGQQLSPANRLIDDTQEWVLFSPIQQTASLLSTEQTPRTAGLSRLSDFGSWNTGAQEGQEEELDLQEEHEDADELDSLDDGLQAFREPNPLNLPRRFDQSGGSMMPAHDGLGTFPASSPPVQEHLYNFELYNKHKPQQQRHHRTLSSVQRQLEAMEDDSEDPTNLDKARRDRIEKWRLDSSRIMIEEIEKEKRSEKGRALKADRVDLGDASQLGDFLQEGQTSRRNDSKVDTPKDDESLWQRIYRRVLEDVIGIDDKTLSVILGETLAEDDALSKTPTKDTLFPQSTEQKETEKEGWHEYLIKRLAKELGLIAQYLSGTPDITPGLAASATMDYAGIPINKGLAQTKSFNTDDSANFLPTIRNRQVSNEHTQARHRERQESESLAAPIAEVDYWEHKPDIKTVLSFLSQRFMSHQCATSEQLPSNIATIHTPASQQRADIIRQHHPLVSRSRATNERRGRRMSIKLNSQVGGRNTTMSPSLKRIGTSCASWSTKRHKFGTSDAGSRNYWDIGGSIGSENVALGGVWGEV